MMEIKRRTFVLAGGLSGLALASGLGIISRDRTPLLLSAANDLDGRHFLVGSYAGGDLAYRIEVPHRAHQAIGVPQTPLAIYFGRRPSTEIYLVDTHEGRLIHKINAPSGRHFYGHGALSRDGTTLYVSENDYQHNRGVISVYQLDPITRQGEFPSGGLGPHQIERISNTDTLVIANGGLQTHPESGREVLNRATMRPNLCYVDLDSTEILESVEPPHNSLSLRHMAVSPGGEVIIGAQDQQSQDSERINPLVYRHRLGTPLTPMGAKPAEWAAMNQYIASLAIANDSSWALSTTPRGNLVSLWDLKGRLPPKHLTLRDVAGALWNQPEQAFWVSNGLGQTFRLPLSASPKLELISHSKHILWDNHLSLNTQWV